MEAVKDMNAGKGKATAGMKTMVKTVEKLSAESSTKDSRISSSKGNLNSFKAYESIQTTMKFLIKYTSNSAIMKDLQTIHNKLLEFKPLYVEAYEKNTRLAILEYENGVYLLVTGLSMTMCSNIEVSQQNDTIRVKKKADSTLSLIAKTVGDYAKQLNSKDHKEYLEAILKETDEVTIKPKTESTYLEATIADTIELIDIIFDNIGKIGRYTLRAARAIKSSFFGIVPLIRSVLYLRYKKKADTILALEQQAQFIQQNIEQLQNRKNMDPKEKALIIKRQQAYVTSYMKKAEKLRAELCETEKAAAQGIKEAPTSDEDGELVLESTEVLPDDFFTEKHLFKGHKNKKGKPSEVANRRLQAATNKMFGRMSSVATKTAQLKPEDKVKVDRIVAEVKKQTKKNSIRLTLEKQIGKEEDEKSCLLKSKIGGVPYWPEGMEWPESKGRNGMVPLTMVAQINFSEMPKLEGYPTSGILQFFIESQDVWDTSGDSVRVIYHTDLKQNQSTEIPKTTHDEKWDEDYGAFVKCFPLSGKLQEVYVNAACDDWTDVLDPLVQKEFGCKFWDLYNSNPPAEHAIYEALHKTGEYYGHRIGGYPYFTQADVRSDEFSELLLQIDSDAVGGSYGGNQGIMWGDCGVANFFIGKEKLARKDFSKVYFTWDCY
jgi:uncharacterized protein YwqG